MSRDQGDVSGRAARIAADLVRDPSTEGTIPDVPGYYAWWVEDGALADFRPEIPVCHPPGAAPGWSLLYVGISPRNSESSATLAGRIRTHRHGKVERSTFRYSIASLLPTLDLTLVGTTPNNNKPRYLSEARLTDWIAANAAVTVAHDASPWTPGLEAAVVNVLAPPLNGSHSIHSFKGQVAAARQEVLRTARDLSRSQPSRVRQTASTPRSGLPREGTRSLAAPPDLESQRITQNDIDRGQVRIPRRSKAAFPSRGQQVIVALRGETIACHWDPRTDGDKERSGILHLGVARLRSISPGTRLTIRRSDDGIELS